LAWNLITLPNLPTWPAGGNFTSAVGSVAYVLFICVASGSTYITPANDSWQTGNFVGAIGQSNLLANAVNSYLDIAFVQHSPGSNTDLMDLDFDTNLRRSERYFRKSYQYADKPGTASYYGTISGQVVSTNLTLIPSNVTWPRMAKSPTLTYYSESGAINNIRNATSNADAAAAAGQFPQETGIMQTMLNANGVAGNIYRYHYVADTGM